MDASPEILGWVNRQLASRNRPTLTALPDGGVRAALPDYRFYRDRSFQVLAYPGLLEGRVPESVYRSVGHQDG